MREIRNVPIFVYVIITLIFIIVVSTCTAFAQEAPAIKQPQKVVVFNKTLYMCTIDNNRNFGVNLHAIKLDREKEVKTYFLPFSIAALKHQSFPDPSIKHDKEVYEYYPLSWDIAEDHFFAIFVSDELYSKGRGFGLLRIPLAKLKEFENLSDKEKSKPFAPELLREFFVDTVHMRLLFYGMDQIKRIQYDFYAANKDLAEFYSLENNTMTIWRYEKRRWSKLAEFISDSIGAFEVVNMDQNIFFVKRCK